MTEQSPNEQPPQQEPQQQEQPTPTTEPPAKPEFTEVSQDARTMGMLCHLLLVFFPMGWLGSLIIWLIERDSSPFVDDQGKEAMNFVITVLIATFALGIITCGFGVPVVILVAIILAILAAIAANKGQAYRYPFAIRLIK
jgi:uncharacterized protein